jgi:polysaccharide pyruvyl transferase WcaK-like protein
MKNIVIVGAGVHSVNKGVEALTYAIVHLVQKIAEKKGANFRIFVLTGSQMQATPQPETIRIGEHETTIYYMRSLDPFSIKGIIKCLIFPKEVVKNLKVNYVLDISGGDSFSDIYGRDRFKDINLSKRFFRFIGKKQLLLPQTIGPFKDKQLQKQAIRSIEAFEIVMARDTTSFEFAQDNTRQKRIYELIDVAFFMPYERKQFDTGKVHVGIGISSLLWIGGYTRDNQFGLQTDYQKLIDQVIQYFLEQSNVQIHLVPHVIRAESHIENDYELSYDIVEKYDTDRLILSPFFLTPTAAKRYISGLDFFIGGRMHACIAAFSSGVPVYPTAYSRKFSGLFGKTLEYGYLGDMTVQTQVEVMDGLKEAFLKRETLRSIISERMNGIVQERYKLFNKLLEEFLV